MARRRPRCGAAAMRPGVLASSAIHLVVNGHDHTYERFAPQTPSGAADPTRGIREFVVGTGGAPLYPFVQIEANSEVRYNGGWGVLKLSLDESSYTWTFITADGAASADAGSGVCVP
jgi:hypothetical protein